LLDERGVPYRYRDYRKEPLTASELRRTLKQLDMSPAQVLRPRDAAYKRLGLTGGEDEATLIEHMAAHPTLLQRPIATVGDRAVVGRPVGAVVQPVEAPRLRAWWR
jgi:arsenate reductase